MRERYCFEIEVTSWDRFEGVPLAHVEVNYNHVGASQEQLSEVYAIYRQRGLYDEIGYACTAADAQLIVDALNLLDNLR